MREINLKSMKVLIDIKDDKADFVMELLNSLSFVKAERISVGKSKFLKELKASVDQVKLAKEGKIKLRSVDELIDEL